MIWRRRLTLFRVILRPMEHIRRPVQMDDVALLWTALCFLGLQARAVWIGSRWLREVIPPGDATGRDSNGETEPAGTQVPSRTGV
jgi:hypothetical protein